MVLHTHLVWVEPHSPLALTLLFSPFATCTQRQPSTLQLPHSPATCPILCPQASFPLSWTLSSSLASIHTAFLCALCALLLSPWQDENSSCFLKEFVLYRNYSVGPSIEWGNENNRKPHQQTYTHSMSEVRTLC